MQCHGASYASMACVYGTIHQIPRLRVSSPWKPYAEVVITMEIACSYTFKTVFPPELTEWRGERERKIWPHQRIYVRILLYRWDSALPLGFCFTVGIPVVKVDDGINELHASDHMKELNVFISKEIICSPGKHPLLEEQTLCYWCYCYQVAIECPCRVIEFWWLWDHTPTWWI